MSTETIEKPAVQEQIEAVLEDVGALRSRGDSEARFAVKFSTTWDEMQKMHAWWDSGRYEQAQALQQANERAWMNSLQYCANYAAREYGSGARVIASVLVSFYNSNICKVDMTDLWLLDAVNFQHVMNTIRLRFAYHCEPYTLFDNGDELFRHIIKRHGLKKGGR